MIARRAALSVALLSLVAPTVALAGRSSTVPPFIEQLVSRKAEANAYSPTRLPFRYRYLSFNVAPTTKVVTLRFADTRFPRDGRHTLTFVVRSNSTSCADGRIKTLQMGGNKVYWDGTRAWRCQGRVRMTATGPGLPDIGLGRVVASGKRFSAS